MTKESKELITEICRNKLWMEDNGISTPDMFGIRFGDSQYSFVVCKEFENAEDAKEYMGKIDELQSIHIKTTVEWGSKGEKYTQDGHLFGAQMYLGKIAYIEVSRIFARALFEVEYFGPKGMCDFITYIDRNKGKHWDDLFGGRTHYDAE